MYRKGGVSQAETSTNAESPFPETNPSLNHKDCTATPVKVKFGSQVSTQDAMPFSETL